MRAPLSYVPALPVAIGWMAGIVLWYFAVAWWMVVVVAAVGVVLMILKRHFPAFAFIAVPLGFAAAIVHAPPQPAADIFDGYPCEFSAVVESCENKPLSMQLILRVDSCRQRPVAPFLTLVRSTPDWTPPPVGSRVNWCGYVEPAITSPDFRGDLDISDFYLYKGVSAVAYVDFYPLQVVGREASSKAWFYDCREWLLATLAKTNLDYQSFGIISALLVGYHDDLDSTMQEQFRATGIAHALALSGFHVGMIVLLVALMLFPLRLSSRLRRLRYMLTIAILWFYAMLVGMSPSVVRSVIMVSVYLLGLIIGSRTNPYNSLCVAILIILAVWPMSLFSPGFQLTVCAVLGILAFARPLTFVSPRRALLYRLNQFFAVTISAVIGTMVVTLFHFHRLPLLFLVSNAYISLCLPVMIYGGVVLLILSALGLPSAWIAAGLNCLVAVITRATDHLAQLSAVEVPGVYLSWPMILWIAVLIAVLAFAINFKTIRWFVASAMVAVAGLGISFLPTAVPVDEIFVMGRSGSSALVMRHNSHVVAIPVSSYPDTVGIAATLARYSVICRVDTLEIGSNGCQLGPFTIDNNSVRYSGHVVAIPGKNDSTDVCADYVVIGSRFKGSVDDMLASFNPQTVIISRSIGRKRVYKLLGALRNSNSTIINMRLQEAILPQPH